MFSYKILRYKNFTFHILIVMFCPMNNVSSQFNPGLTVQELCTVDYRADDAPEAGAKEMQSWKDRKLNNRVIAVEKCALLVGQSAVRIIDDQPWAER